MNTDDDSRSKIPPSEASQAQANPLFEIGEYEWCEPDYRQILLWAGALRLEPEEVIRRLLDTSLAPPEQEVYDEEENDFFEETAFRDGRLLRLQWNLALLPIAEFKWMDGLEIETITIVTPQPDVNRMPHLKLNLPKLRMLHCVGIGLEQMDLDRVPNLEEIWCGHNRLTTLDLSKVPLLRFFYCSENSLVGINVSRASKLEQLECERNNLTALDVSRTDSLRHLDCSDNRLREVNLERKWELKSLYCSGNLLVRLHLTETSIESPCDVSCDDWVYVTCNDSTYGSVGNGALGFFPPEVFERLRRDETQPKSAFSDWEAYLNHHGYTCRPRESQP